MPIRCVALIALLFVIPASAQHLAQRPRLSISTPVEQPVVLQSVRIDSELGGGIAGTSVELTFYNPNERQLEGELTFPLADGQSVSGLAMDLDGALREAVPVEKARGQMIFEDVTRQRIDPALLEATLGNHYKLRVYPILPRSTKRVVVRYDEALGGHRGLRRYRVPIEYADRVASFAMTIVVHGDRARPAVVHGAGTDLAFVRAGDAWRARVERRDYAARGFVEIAVALPSGPQVTTEFRAGRTYFRAEVPVPAIPTRPRLLPRSVGLVWDSSGSGEKRDHARELALLDAYFRRLGSGEVQLIRLRERAEAAGTFRIEAGDWTALRRELETTVYDGATNLGAFRPSNGIDEYLLVSDGLSTFGDAPFARTQARVYAIASTVGSDATRLRAIAHANGGRFIDLTSTGVNAAARQLLHDSARLVRVDGDGVDELVTASPYPDRGRLVVAGVVTAPVATLRLSVGRDARTVRVVRVAVDAGAASGALAASSWARLQVAALDGDYELNRAAIRDLGKRFGLVTRETSLIVLDRLEDYVRYEVAPPPELAAEYARQRSVLAKRRQHDEAAQIERVLAMLRQKEAWWHRDFPKGERPAPRPIAQQPAARQEHERRSQRREGLAQLPASPAAADAPAVARLSAPRADAAAKSAADSRAGAEVIAIRVKAWTPDAAYIARLRAAATSDVYRVYLEHRPAYASSTAFFLDAADELFARGQHELALRVLGNLAELDLENRHILRILGYRLLQAGEPALALPVLRRVLALSPEEPQSYRDLGLAYAADRQWQRAVDLLHDVVRKPWHGRFPEVELIALAELNAIVASCGEPVDTSAIDARLLKNLPVDLRVVLAWDADNTDIDLWVTDPNGERAYYGHPLTFQGGRMSRDFTGGYGPEEFSLKTAKPGKYVVEAHFFGHRQQIVAGATTLQVKFQTRFGTAAMNERSVTLRLQGQGGQVAVGEFELPAPQ